MKNKIIKFSIIIPVYNNPKYIKDSVDSIVNQEENAYDLEIIIIDDCSTDDTPLILKQLAKENTLIRVFSTEVNSGPGIARNIGIDNSSGDWILFLDSDDKLQGNALKILTEEIKNNNESEIFSYNWDFDKSSTAYSNKSGGRYDFYSLKKNKEEMLLDYLSLGIDGSVIYTLMSSNLLKNRKLRFRGGFHEDVDLIFKAYFFTKNICIVETPLYLKNNRKDSIVNSISTKHIEGFFSAYIEIFEFLKKEEGLSNKVLKFLYIGVVGIVASRVREIWFHSSSNESKINLYRKLYSEFKIYESKYLFNVPFPNLDTRFFKIYGFFIELIESNSLSIEKEMDSFLSEIVNKSWSCYDLHNSIFLAPNEIRTCCKRFFDDDKMKGDVVLVKDNFTPENILKAKKDLYTSINKGQSEECRNCPFLEFKEWGYIDSLNVEHLSFEYHSVCNMKCVYCSDTYYGGEKSSYDVENLFDEIETSNGFKNMKSIVWGGGEPTLDKSFSPLLSKTSNIFPNIKQRIITNATVFKEDILKYLNEDKVTITTSIDAGNENTFNKLRENKNFFKVLENLKKYATNKPKNITIKYIVMDENKSIEEIKEFVNYIKQYNLQKCNFQISFDFKKSEIDIDSTISMIILYGLLNTLDARLVFFDDLLLQRLKNISKEKILAITNQLQKLKMDHFLITKLNYEKIVIWGAGQQTRLLIQDSKMLQDIEIVCIVDNDKNKIGSKYFGYDVLDPEELQNNEYPIYIAAVQSTPVILKQYESLSLNKNRLVKGLLF